MRQLFVASEQIIHCPVSLVLLYCISVQLGIIIVIITIESVGFVQYAHVLYIYPMTNLQYICIQ